MASLDIFNDDAFAVSALTQTITDVPRTPTKLGDMGLFNQYGIPSLTMMIERQGASLKLVPTAPRGGVREPVSLGRRNLIPIAASHLPQSASVLADEVQGIRAFGSETEVEAVTPLVKRKLALMKGNLDLTLEYHRVGALKGQVLDADGSSVIMDVYDTFGMTQEVQFFNVATVNSGADLKAASRALKRKIQAKLGGRSMSGIRAIVSEGFFDKFTGNNDMKEAWKLWQNGQYSRELQDEESFTFLGVTYTVYSGGVGETDFIPDGKGYAFPMGVPNMFQQAFAPADYMETVNTNGLPYYAKQERMKFNKGVEMESQSNPITFNALPELVIELDVAAS